jgi:hypothetical protein
MKEGVMGHTALVEEVRSENKFLIEKPESNVTWGIQA